MTKVEFLQLGVRLSKSGEFPGRNKNADGHYMSGCRYLTDDGRKCHVGHPLPDGHRGQRFHGSVVGLLELHPDLKYRMPSGMTAYELQAAQTAHDSTSYSDGWEHDEYVENLVRAFPEHEKEIREEDARA